MPSKRNSSQIFYGWWIVVASFFIALYMGGAVFYGFTAIFEPIANEFGWSYTQVSLAASLRGLEVGLLAPLVGMLTDRWGPRRIIFSGAVCTAMGFILLSYTTSLAMFYGAFVLIAIGMSNCTMTVLMTAIAKWFRRKVGLASGIAVCGFGFGGLVVPLIVKLVEIQGWRITMIILALGVLAIVLPLSLLFRHKPEQYGYLPDGHAESPAALDSVTGLPQAAKADVKMKQVIKSITFWHIALAFMVHTMMVNAVVTHVMPYLSSIGIARSRSSLVATSLPIVSIGGRIGLGTLGDKLDRRRVVATAFAMMGLGMLCFGYAPSMGAWLLIPFVVLFSVGFGGNNALRPSLVSDYFGRASFGTIFGLIIGINMLGSMLGPPLAGWAYDNYGSYQGIWFVFAALPFLSLVSILTTPPINTAAKLIDKA